MCVHNCTNNISLYAQIEEVYVTPGWMGGVEMVGKDFRSGFGPVLEGLSLTVTGDVNQSDVGQQSARNPSRPFPPPSCPIPYFRP
eukprot:1394075-Amorphochlora_amoeboformis.AAC.2